MIISALESGASVYESVELSRWIQLATLYIGIPIGPFTDKDELHRFLLSRVWCDEKDVIVHIWVICLVW